MAINEDSMITTRIYVEHPDMALVPTIRSLADAEFGVVPDAGTDPQHRAHFFWVEADDFDAVERQFEADHTVESFSVVATGDHRRTYRIKYSDAATLITPSIVGAGGLVMESRSHSNGWELTLHLQTHETLYNLGEFADSEGIQFDVLELQQAQDVDSEFELTEPQIEALVSAYLNGYYDEPREVTLEGLASLLDISQTAVSGRLRRGSARLIEETLIDDE